MDILNNLPHAAAVIQDVLHHHREGTRCNCSVCCRSLRGIDLLSSGSDVDGNESDLLGTVWSSVVEFEGEADESVLIAVLQDSPVCFAPSWSPESISCGVLYLQMMATIEYGAHTTPAVFFRSARRDQLVPTGGYCALYRLPVILRS
jgi:hypothetical protein